MFIGHIEYMRACVCVCVNIVGKPIIRYALLDPNTKSEEVEMVQLMYWTLNHSSNSPRLSVLLSG